MHYHIRVSTHSNISNTLLPKPKDTRSSPSKGTVRLKNHTFIFFLSLCKTNALSNFLLNWKIKTGTTSDIRELCHYAYAKLLMRMLKKKSSETGSL